MSQSRKYFDMGLFTFIETPLTGLTLIERNFHEDSRGFFERLFCAEEFQSIGFIDQILQINHSKTLKDGTVRGMHYQHPPFVETKIVTCIQGAVFDVAVDLRCNSPTFLQWHGAILSATNQHSLLIPQGFAHGFQTLSADCELLYLHSAAYVASAEGAVNAIDPIIKISWPKSITSMSERDQHHPFIKEDFAGITV